MTIIRSAKYIQSYIQPLLFLFSPTQTPPQLKNVENRRKLNMHKMKPIFKGRDPDFECDFVYLHKKSNRLTLESIRHR